MVGKELVYELIEDKKVESLIAVVRRPLPIAHPKLKQLVEVDFTKLESLGTQLRAQTFYCCIGTTLKKAGSREAFRKVDYEIPLAIGRLAESLGIPSLVIISSIAANGQSGNFYLRTKGQMEEQVKMIYHGNLKIIRPSMILGHRHEIRFAEKIANVIIPVLGVFMLGPLRKYKGIYYWEIARAMIQAVTLPKEQVVVESDELHKLSSIRVKPTARPSGMI